MVHNKRASKLGKVKESAKDLGLQQGYYRQIDEFGMGWEMPEQGEHCYDLYLSPLSNAQAVKDVKDYL